MVWGKGESHARSSIPFSFSIAGSLLKRRPEVMGEAEKATAGADKRWGRQDKSVQPSTFIQPIID